MTITSIFILGSIGFWILVGGTFCFIMYLVENEVTSWATFTLIAFFAALGFFGDFNILTLIIEHPILAVVCLIAYLFIGILWSFIKLALYARNRNNKYSQQKETYLKKGGSETTWFSNHSYDFDHNETVNHSSKIINWSAFWVWSMIWTIINDPIMKFFKWIFRSYFKIYDWIFKKMTVDIETDKFKYKQEKEK